MGQLKLHPSRSVKAANKYFTPQFLEPRIARFFYLNPFFPLPSRGKSLMDCDNNFFKCIDHLIDLRARSNKGWCQHEGVARGTC